MSEIEYLFRDDRTLTMLGMKGSGKTNCAAVFIKLLVELGFEVWTNIHFFEFEKVGEACNKGKLHKGVTYRRVPPEVHVVSSLSELLLGLVKDCKKVVILDEAGIHASSSRPMSKDTVTIKQLAYIIRHFESALLLITQTRGSIPPDLRTKLVDFELNIKKSKYRRRLEIGKRKEVRNELGEVYIDFPVIKTFKKIPPAVLPYDSKFPTGFEIDIDLKKALSELSKAKSTLEVMGGEGRDIIEKLLKDTKIEKPYTKKDQIKEFKARNKDMDREEIAKIFNTTPNYVSQC